MIITPIRCECGTVEVHLAGTPILQYVCHCDDCQAVHGAAYPVALFLASAVVFKQGKTSTVTRKTSPRTKCSCCGTYVFSEVPGQPFYGVNGHLLPAGQLKPEFHVQCQYATSRIEDHLPHYRDTPVSFRGSGELMSW